MASAGKSRWADTEEDAALEARLKREKEDKRRKRAEKARRLEQQQQQQQATALAAAQGRDESPGGGGDGDGDDDGSRPSKRRRLALEPDAADTGRSPAELLRFETGSWGATRNVENYDKLNDIEEGTYGWVARGTEKATGKVVALKRLKLEPQDRSGLPVTGLREIQILKDCNHPNIVGLHEVVVGDDLSGLDK
ncbi:Cyclin-dependent kinase G-1 [Tolypocladium capitatum]|uniref:cyclin-dependent kinase n=1 Tax=Tolypocladium capitatum TaxID=45235 RepID=A0A2K3QLN9_9HYPO|nr:Cyclin-dependent kinase G-1 [Tolypocladium capitatum]